MTDEPTNPPIESEVEEVKTPVVFPTLVFPIKSEVEEPLIPQVLTVLPTTLEIEESEHAKILKEHGGLESNIPINHRYWRIRP